MGRKTLYRPEMAQKLPEMFEEGQTMAEVSKKLGVSSRTFLNWVGRFPEFREAYELGKTFSEAWWAEHLRHMATRSTPGNTAIAIFTLKTRFGWAEGTAIAKTAKEIADEVREAINKASDETCPVPKPNLHVVE